MKKIKLNNSEKYALVDNEDYERLVTVVWNFDPGGYSKGKTGKGYAKSSGKVYTHRLLTNAPKGMVVDHINNNPLDNRRSNLRLTTRHFNALNRVQRSNSTGPYKGVTLQNSKKNPYGAVICYKGKNRRLGNFKTAMSARRAYLKEARRLHGEFAR